MTTTVDHSAAAGSFQPNFATTLSNYSFCFAAVVVVVVDYSNCRPTFDRQSGEPETKCSAFDGHESCDDDDDDEDCESECVVVAAVAFGRLHFATKSSRADLTLALTFDWRE